ncbi:response regulator transcription factor [Flavobacterium sp. GSP27]|uniref:Response regulator transcription factor n=1 Tax=Flavobacterium bomense TaxID=2497483 RepID=A0A3S0PIZ1_9FLAO|nr:MULTISPECIES: response regulator transcription factor [Flavobacterium]RTY94286.1 response regulator transcription factor [Flavobacterium sp. GSN2]RTY65264.1 response regulator transcription factor [Flavobacterium sp. LB2P53]RTY74135.1 response regulator transcription factor [Flavobacterium sp. LS1R10]RTY83585.1 response regulator transcription factor [Flavobacterium sp. LS1P28]RTY83625.1 response regulator transcription factor [Flavobacterium sp. ZB4P23]
MFHKVLVAEDLDTISIAIIQALRELSILEIHHAKYCDEAFLKIKRALHDKVPYDLLISDLSFKPDHRQDRLSSGEELIEAVKKEQPELKTIVFSIEDKSFRIKSLYTNLGINAYVSKGRDSIPELKKTIQNIYNNKNLHPSEEVRHALRNKSLFEIEAYDILLLKSLSNGLTLEDIASEFKNSGIIPSGTSSLEKRINRLKIYFKANNNVHLIAITKDLGLV